MSFRFFHPRYWQVWIGLGVIRVIILLPWKLQQYLGHLLGLLMFSLLKSRRFISCVNLELAFPELSDEQRRSLNREHFSCLGKSVFETPSAWWGSDKRLKKLHHIDGLNNLKDAQKKKKGIVLLSAHTTSLELGGRLLAMYSPLSAVYRPHQNELFDVVVNNARIFRYGQTIPHNNIKKMILSLKKGKMVWYAQDQSPKNKRNSVFSPFFNVSTATNTALSRIASLGNAEIVPFFAFRESGGYRLVILPALSNFPSGSKLNDAMVINKTIEEQVRKYPDQYLWVHKRFKDLPEESGDRYKKYDRSTGGC